jgi:hypothetical protein
VPILVDKMFMYTIDRKAVGVAREVQRGHTSVESWFGRWNIKMNDGKNQAVYFCRGNRPVFHEEAKHLLYISFKPSLCKR